MEGFRARARTVLDNLEGDAEPYSDLQATLAEARLELDGGESSARSGVAEKLADGSREVVDPEGLG